eukprot:scaffold65992_cov75-Phaeocystis_antarctica.AAC.1
MLWALFCCTGVAWSRARGASGVAKGVLHLRRKIDGAVKVRLTRRRLNQVADIRHKGCLALLVQRRDGRQLVVDAHGVARLRPSLCLHLNDLTAWERHI